MEYKGRKFKKKGQNVLNIAEKFSKPMSGVDQSMLKLHRNKTSKGYGEDTSN